MAYNLKTDETAYHVKLTAIGRELLAHGTLNYQGFAVGDSEVDYQAADATATDLTTLRVLRPVDNQSDIKYPISPTSGVSPVATLSGKVGEQHVIQNVAPSRGPFRRTSNLTPENRLDLTRPGDDGRVTVIRDAFLVTPNGTDTVTSDSASPVASAGDWLLVHCIPLAWTSPIGSLESQYEFSADKPGAYLLYRIKEVSGQNLILDRPAPRYKAGPGPCPAFVFPGGNAIEDVYGAADPVTDWNEDQLAFVPTPPVASAQVGLWNCNIVYGEAPMGGQNFPWGGYPSNTYGGTRRYLGYAGAGSPIAILHYSNHVVHNLYGESLVPATVQVNLPSVMWWGDAEGKGGLLLTTDPRRQQVTGGSASFNLIFHTLMDAKGLGVGRVYPTLKVIVLDDPELVSALSAKSNRNWTLPPFDYLSAGGSDGASDNGRTLDLRGPLPVGELKPDTKTLHVTYAFVNDSTGEPSTSQGYGYYSALPCQYVSRSQVSLDKLQYFEFKLATSTLAHFQDQTSNSGVGYTAERMLILFQETVTGVRPAADSWLACDVTATLSPAPAADSTISRDVFTKIYKVDGEDLRAIRDSVLANGGYYMLPDIGSAEAGGLTFGEETVLLGNVSTSIEAIAFRTSFLLNLPEGAYGTSSNPTWQAGQPVAITELGIYDSNNNIVAMGKVTDPLLKVVQQPLFLEVSLDF